MSDSNWNTLNNNEPDVISQNTLADDTPLDNNSTTTNPVNTASSDDFSSNHNFQTEEMNQTTNTSDTFYENTTQETQSEQTFYTYQSYGSTVPDPVKKEHPVLKKIAKLIACAACFGVVAGSCFFGTTKLYEYIFPNSPIVTQLSETTSKTPILIPSTETNTVGELDASETVTEVVKNAMPAMVSITSTVQSTSYFFGQPYTEESTSGGSGIIVGKNDTDILIATNHHVIDNAVSIAVTFTDGSTAQALVKGSDALADLAIIAISLNTLTEETLSNIDIAVLGDSEDANVGEMVIAIGNALGYGPTTTVGYLSAKDREVNIDGNNMILLQTNAAINHGNSGGALLNSRGEVIGINNAKLSSTSIEGICFAIPISKATPILNELMSREILAEEEKGYLGISVKELDSSIFQFFSDWPEGVYVYSVSEGSPAEAAGIYSGDIITAINGVSVTTSNQLINAVTSNRIGTEIEVTLQRNVNGAFEQFVYRITLGPKPVTN